MASRSIRNKLGNFVSQCISLSSSEGITTVFGIAILVMFFLNPQHIPLPDLCLIKKIFGYCPACGTTRALTCFFKGEFAESIKYNCNVILTAPLIVLLFLKNLIKVMGKWDFLNKRREYVLPKMR